MLFAPPIYVFLPPENAIVQKKKEQQLYRYYPYMPRSPYMWTTVETPSKVTKVHGTSNQAIIPSSPNPSL